LPCRAPPPGVACHVVVRAPAVGPALSARETFTRTLTRVFKHAGPRRSAVAASCRPVRFTGRAGSPAGGVGRRKAPRLHVLGGGALDPSSARSGCGYLPPQRTSSRDLCPILPMPRTADAVARRAAESITTVRTAPPATQGRRDNPTDIHPSRLIHRRHGAPLRRARLRRGPVRQRRGGGHECQMRHPEGGGGEGGGHREALLRFVSQSVRRASATRYVREPAADSVQTKNGRRVPTAPFPRRSRLADQPLRARCCADGLGRDSRLLRRRLSRSPHAVNPLLANISIGAVGTWPQIVGIAEVGVGLNPCDYPPSIRRSPHDSGGDVGHAAASTRKRETSAPRRAESARSESAACSPSPALVPPASWAMVNMPASS